MRTFIFQAIQLATRNQFKLWFQQKLQACLLCLNVCQLSIKVLYEMSALYLYC